MTADGMPGPTPFASIPVKSLSEDDRPREKALRLGTGALSDAELLALVIGGGLPGLSVVDLSRNMLLANRSSLLELSKVTPADMRRRFKGIGTAKSVQLGAVFELCRRWRDETVRAAARRPDRIGSSRDAYDIIRSDVEALPYETFWVLMLSRSNAVIEKRLVSQGGTASTVVDAKVVFHHAVNAMASGMVLVHNHPSGNLQPSAQDDALTRRLVEAGRVLDIRVLDHLVVGSGGYYSYSDQGRMPQP